MRVAIHQPQYWPWAPYLHKVMFADVFVYLDTVQFSKNGLQNRNRVRTPQGALWLSLPVSHNLGQTIRETRLADPRAVTKHYKTLQANYARAPGFQLWKKELEALFSPTTANLCDVAIATTEWMLDKIGTPARRLRASELVGLSSEIHGSALVTAICQQLGAQAYLTGRGALTYLRQQDFAMIRCEVWAQKWRGLTYSQAHSHSGSVPELSALDLLLNHPNDAGRLIEAAGGWELLWSPS